MYMEAQRKRRSDAHRSRTKKASPLKRILVGIVGTIAVLIILLYGYLLITA